MSKGDCEKIRPYLVDFVVGELDTEKVKELDIEKHLSECEDCRSASEELRGTGRALEAVRTLDTGLRDELRTNITSRARVEAQIVRATRQHQKIAGLAKPRRVPPAAWILLIAGAAGALFLVSFLPNLLPADTQPPALVLGHVGDGIKNLYSTEKSRSLKPGQTLSVPDQCSLCIKLGDGSRLDLHGPARVRLAGREGPLRIEKGRAFLRTSEGETELDIEPLRKLSVGRNARLSLGIDPVQERAALLTVLAGEISFVATGGSRVVGAGKSVEINGRSHQAKIREMVEADRPVWRNELPAEHR